jgi:hypothetical protein
MFYAEVRGPHLPERLDLHHLRNQPLRLEPLGLQEQLLRRVLPSTAGAPAAGSANATMLSSLSVAPLTATK